MKIARNVVLGGSLFVSMAVASSDRLVVQAPVVSVDPVVRTITDKIPHQSCWDERVRLQSRGGHRSAVPQVLGAVIGGATAGAIGDNTGHQGVIATAGALLGAAVGHDVAHQRSATTRYVTEQRCETSYELRDREEVVGYRVSYEYAGGIYHARTRHRPGPTIEVGVILEPVVN